MQGDPAVLVDRSSATHGRLWENEEHHIHAIERDHSNLIKFCYRNEIYDRIREHLQGFAMDAVKVIKLRLANQFGNGNGTEVTIIHNWLILGIKPNAKAN